MTREKKRNYPIKHRWWIYTSDGERLYTGFSCCGIRNYMVERIDKTKSAVRFSIGEPDSPISCKRCLKCGPCKKARGL